MNVRITSSANRLILCWDFAVSTPFILGWDLIASAKGFITIENIRGDRGHPFVMENDLDNRPRTCADGREYRALIAEITLP